LVGEGGGYFKGEDTALRIAAEFGHAEVVELLLKADDDPNHADAEKVTRTSLNCFVRTVRS
jgi:ankyrin repeat protein